jgi:hypothetical protein
VVLETRLQVVGVASVLATMALGWLAATLFGFTPAIGFALGVPVGFGVRRWAAQRMVRRAFDELRAAMIAEDAAAARSTFEQLAHLRRWAGWRSVLDLHEASVLMAEQRWTAARTRLEAMDPARLPWWAPAHYDAMLGMAMAKSGDTAAAVSVAQRALTHPVRMRRAERGKLLLALGMVNVLAARPTEALATLDRYDPPGDARLRAIRAFYRGEALRALGRTDDAARAYEAAVQGSPNTRHGRLAREQLEMLGVPYR